MEAIGPSEECRIVAEEQPTEGPEARVEDVEVLAAPVSPGLDAEARVREVVHEVGADELRLPASEEAVVLGHGWRR
eukprot:12507269-Heterocapsa_arctica.AAC.1